MNGISKCPQTRPIGPVFGRYSKSKHLDNFFIRIVAFCDHLPVFAGILIFRFPGLESYLMRPTASYSFEELVAGDLFELAADRDRVSARCV